MAELELQASVRQLKTDFWPATFEERGVTLPFTTPMLANSRVRKAEFGGTLEVLVPGMSGAEGTYVLTWPSMREMFRMTVYDRALHESIEYEEATTPLSMRYCVLDTAISGLAGAEAIKAAELAQTNEQNESLLTQFHMVSHVIDELSPSGARLGLAELATPKGEDKARGMIGEIAQNMGLSAEALYDDVERWSRAIAPVGMKKMPQQCRLRRSLTELTAFRMGMENFAATSKSEAAHTAHLASEVSKLTIHIASKLIDELDKLTQNPAKVLSNLEPTMKKIDEDISRLSWLIDGWDHIALLWKEAEHQEPAVQEDALAEIYRLLPLVPRDELKEMGAEALRNLQKELRTHVRAIHSWTTGDLDIELQLRLEKMRTETMR